MMMGFMNFVQFKSVVRVARIVAHLEPSPVELASNMGTGSCPGCCTSESAPCL